MILANIAKQTMNKIITTQKILWGMEKAPYLELDNIAYTVLTALAQNVGRVSKKGLFFMTKLIIPSGWKGDWIPHLTS